MRFPRPFALCLLCTPFAPPCSAPLWAAGLAQASTELEAAPSQLDDSPEPWLARLSSGSATEREAAQRWLGIHLRAVHYPALATRARGADPETSQRLARALGSDDRHLDLIAFLLCEKHEDLVQLGENAFEDLVERWCPAALKDPVVKSRVQLVLNERADRSYKSSARTEPFAAAIERLSRLCDFGVPLVLAPELAELEVNVSAKEGQPLEHLSEICADQNVLFVGIGEWEAKVAGQGAWLLVAPKANSRSRIAAARLASWCRSVELGSTQAKAAAQALAATGWPAALEWLDARWAERRDENALEGLLLAAAQGRVGRSLHRGGEREELLERADAALFRDGLWVDDEIGSPQPDVRVKVRFAERIARALIGAGSMTLGGEDRSAHLVANWDGLNSAQRWLRMSILEGQRGGGQRVQEFLRAKLQEARMQPAMRFQTLRALAASAQTTQEPVQVAEWVELVRWALERGMERELLSLFDAVGFAPWLPELGSTPAERLFVLRSRLHAHDVAESASQLKRCAADVLHPERSRLAEVLADARMDFGPRFLIEVTERVLENAPWAETHLFLEICLLGGCLDGRRQIELMKELETRESLRAVEFEWLGALAAGPAGSKARAKLLSPLAEPSQDTALLDGLARGLDRAVQALLESGQDQERAFLIESVWRAASDPLSPLHLRLRAPVWPRPHPQLLIDMARLEREVPAGLY